MQNDVRHASEQTSSLVTLKSEWRAHVCQASDESKPKKTTANDIKSGTIGVGTPRNTFASAVVSVD